MSTEPAGPDPLGLTRPAVTIGPRDRAAGLLADLGLTPRAVAGAFVVVLVAALGWWWLRSPAPPPAEAGVPLVPAATGTGDAPGVTALAEATVAGTGPLAAHAAGAVRRPGLYELPVGSRVADLLAAAGGPRPGADLDRVNLAAPVVDGTQVYVPRRGEAGAPAAATDGGAGAASGDGPPAPVDLNRAGPDELETLPGVGPATAAAIIEYREANGPFATVEDLIDVPGIGEAKLAAVADLVTV